MGLHRREVVWEGTGEDEGLDSVSEPRRCMLPAFLGEDSAACRSRDMASAWRESSRKTWGTPTSSAAKPRSTCSPYLTCSGSTSRCQHRRAIVKYRGPMQGAARCDDWHADKTRGWVGTSRA